MVKTVSGNRKGTPDTFWSMTRRTLRPLEQPAHPIATRTARNTDERFNGTSLHVNGEFAEQRSPGQHRRRVGGAGEELLRGYGEREQILGSRRRLQSAAFPGLE